jgi:CubicO group peptidase (beta-lactamase class C family)
MPASIETIRDEKSAMRARRASARVRQPWDWQARQAALALPSHLLGSWFMRSPILAVSLGVAALSPLSASEIAPARLCKASAEAIDRLAAATMEQGSPGMIVEVARDGEVLFAGTYGLANFEDQVPVTRETVFKLASITKTFTAALILSLAEDGKLSLDDPLSKHVPELTQAKNVTIQQLLVHTSGIPDYAEDPAGEKTKPVAKTPAEMLAWIAALQPPRLFAPGTKWAYSNSNYALLGIVAERAGGKALTELYRERLFAPAGVTTLAVDDPADVVPHRARGYRRIKGPGRFANAAWIHPSVPGPAGALRGTADDLIRFSHALYGGRILKPASLQRLQEPGRLNDGRTTKYGMPVEWQKGLNSDYGPGLFIKPTRGGIRLGHSGDIDGFSTWMAYYPASRVTIVHMINSQSADMDTDAIEAAVFSKPGGPCIGGRALIADGAATG